jgi:glucokinase
MKSLFTITSAEMRRINRAAILETIRWQSPIARSTIAKTLHVSLPTVMRIVDDLVGDGFVRRQGATEWSGGRRRPLLEFNREGSIVIGVDLGGTKMFGAVSDLGGRVLDEIEFVRHGTSGEDSFLRLVELIEELLRSPRIEGRKIQGIGVGAPGITYHTKGVVQWAPSLGWREYPLREKLMERFNIPISVDNDVNLATLGELSFGAGRNVQNLVFIAIGTGIGSGIVIDGVLYRGIHESAGEIGYSLVSREQLGRNYGGFGALEGLASGVGIAERGRSAKAGQKDNMQRDTMLAEDVFDAMRRGEEWAKPIISETVDYLAMTIANISTFFDPELIILGGGVSRSADLLIEPILERIMGTIPVLPRLSASELGRRAAVMGAITNVLHNTSDFYWLKKIS